jgi:outer membrane autotransporter protein
MKNKIKLILSLAAFNACVAHAKAPHHSSGRFVLGTEFNRAFLGKEADDASSDNLPNIYHVNIKTGYEFGLSRQTSITPTISFGHRNATTEGLMGLSDNAMAPMYDAKLRVDFNKYLKSAPKARFYGGLGVGHKWHSTDVEVKSEDSDGKDITYGIAEVGLGYQLFEHFEIASGYGYGYSFSKTQGNSHSLNVSMNFLF